MRVEPLGWHLGLVTLKSVLSWAVPARRQNRLDTVGNVQPISNLKPLTAEPLSLQLLWGLFWVTALSLEGRSATRLQQDLQFRGQGPVRPPSVALNLPAALSGPPLPRAWRAPFLHLASSRVAPRTRVHLSAQACERWLHSATHPDVRPGTAARPRGHIRCPSSSRNLSQPPRNSQLHPYPGWSRPMGPAL